MNVATGRKFTRTFKEQAVQLVQSDKPVSQVAAELEIRSNMLYRRVNQFGNASDNSGSSSDPTGELRRLQRQITELKMENAN